jgi:predicted metal-dependent hydrolase
MSIQASSPQALDSDRMTVRQLPFQFGTQKPSWHPLKPEFAHMVNAASLAMPYLEPYLIRTMRAARPLLADAALQAELDLYIKQEATHYKQHRRFNDTLAAQGYDSIPVLEGRLADDYEKLGRMRSLRFNLAYAEGFESMALALGEMLIEDREFLFGHSDSAVASLVLWHFVEEIEHKNVAFDVFHHLHASYMWRMIGLFYATAHIFWRTGQGYRALLKEDGLWQSRPSRWTLLKLLGRIVGNITPKWLRIMRPGYHPSQIKDPAWGLAWAAMFRQSAESAATLDTGRLDEDHPIGQSEIAAQDMRP